VLDSRNIVAWKKKELFGWILSCCMRYVRMSLLFCKSFQIHFT